MSFDPKDWATEGSPLHQHIEERNVAALESYKANPLLIFEHANIERSTAQGGYGRRQLYELIQNGADALVGTKGGRIHGILTNDALYCANEGEPIDAEGIDALMSSHISMKRGAEIGRFGLGFKSVLGVTGAPEFYSWSVSFRFHEQWSADEINRNVPAYRERVGIGAQSDDRMPVLRLAQPVDPVAAAAEDPLLAELMGWATTVVKLRLPEKEQAQQHWLENDIEDFPSEFLLFSAHVAQLRLEHKPSLLDRRIDIELNDGATYLSEDGASGAWSIFSVPNYRPSDVARADAGELAHRETVPIIWAVPHSGAGRQATGSFWAFFPTEYETTLAGILNAPWKTNEDRQNLLPGEFNNELLSRAAELVVESLPHIAVGDDPGYLLELMPGRGREARNWADDLLTSTVYDLAAERPSLPDLQGKLQRPGQLRLHPAEINRAELDRWAEYALQPDSGVQSDKWCHPSVTANRDRAARASRLIETAGSSTCSLAEWLESLLIDPSVDGSAAAIRIAAAILETSPEFGNDIRGAQIVLTSSGHIVPADTPGLFLSAKDGASQELLYVASDLFGDGSVRLALDQLGVREIDAIGELRALVAETLEGRPDWEHLWNLVGTVPPTDAVSVLGLALDADLFFGVKTMSGTWEDLTQVLLPGAIVTGMGDDAGVAVDLEYHADHLEVLKLIGVAEGPTIDGGRRWEAWFKDYWGWALDQYLEGLPAKGSRPVESLLESEKSTFTGPMAPLLLLEASDARTRFTTHALSVLDADPWRIFHSTVAKYPELPVMSPAVWLLRSEGYLETNLGPRVVRDCVGPGLANWDGLLPMAAISDEAADILGLARTSDQLRDDQWLMAFEKSLVSTDDAVVGDFYASFAEWLKAEWDSYEPDSEQFEPPDPPSEIRCRTGDENQVLSPRAVTVVHTRHHHNALRERGVPALLVPSIEAGLLLQESWGLRSSDDQVRVEIVAVPSSLEGPLTDYFPDLTLLLTDEQLRWRLQPCEVLQIVTLTEGGKNSEDTPFSRERELVRYTETMPDDELLTRLCVELGVSLNDSEREAILLHQEDRAAEELARKVAAEPDTRSRILGLFDDDQLRRHLPGTLLSTVEDLEGPIDSSSVVDLAVAVYGSGLLREMRDELADLGLNPPSTWSGSRPARRFAADLGFPAEFAGLHQPPRQPFIQVHGPASLPPMHEFQIQISVATRKLLRGEGGLRGLLSLPTGAGKTRIIIQAIIESIKAGELAGPLLWVAQTDELCEQAVETWAHLWRAIGAEEPLHVNRLWASREATPVVDRNQVVVATIAKLMGCIDKPSYSWLAKAQCIVIDEAHGSIAPSYTSLLNWLGMGRGKARAPLVGLTATPFRGTSETETERLVARYERRRLDSGIFDGDPYSALQDLGVLAQVRHDLVAGSEITLTTEELSELEKTRRLPSAVRERVGADTDRNRTLLNSIAALSPDWPVLVFAASVDHAQTMAALLTLNDVTAAVITANTDPGARRSAIEDFRSGQLRVLTNYGVLSQGFDAPAIRAVYVARPTYSPNLYQQMIGRGLRGPLNGGKDECLIVNVSDNIAQYGERLAFHDFEYLWDGPLDTASA